MKPRTWNAAVALVVAAVVSSVGATDALVINVIPQVARSYTERLPEKRLDWDAHSEKLQQRGRFQRYYRMPLGKFRTLAGSLRHRDGKMSSTWQEGAASSSAAHAPLSAELRLSMTLRYLAGGSYMDIALIHGVSFNGVHKIFDRTLNDLNELPELDNMHFNTDIQSSQQARRSSPRLCPPMRWGYPNPNPNPDPDPNPEIRTLTLAARLEP
jgi:hypothetical protein